MFRRIIACVDGSKQAMRAAITAIELAKRCDARLTFISVSSEPSKEVDEELQRFMEVEHLERLPDEAIDRARTKLLQSVTDHAKKKAHRNVDSIMRTGHPARTIVDFARNTGADLIVMGSRGLGDVESVLIGSVSLEVSSQSSCACLLVK
jgi:nucleotide-binding universal stress UspA family protein